jgi:hypothetical protein
MHFVVRRAPRRTAEYGGITVYICLVFCLRHGRRAARAVGTLTYACSCLRVETCRTYYYKDVLHQSARY